MKNITFHSKILPEVQSIEEENEKTQLYIDNIYDKFPSEANINHQGYAQEKLMNFRYVPLKYIIPNGSYVRFIDLRTPYDATLFSGGFVTRDNGHSVVVRASRDERVFTFDRRKYAVFLQMTVDDQMRIQMRNMHDD